MSSPLQLMREADNTECGPLSLILDALLYVDRGYYRAEIFSDTYHHLMQPGGLITLTRNMVDRLGLEVKFESALHSFEFPSGAMLRLSYFGNDPNWPYRYSGASMQYIGFETGQRLRGEQYRFMFSRLRRTLHATQDRLPLRMSVLFEPGGLDNCDWLHNIPSTNLRVTSLNCRTHMSTEHANDHFLHHAAS